MACIASGDGAGTGVGPGAALPNRRWRKARKAGRARFPESHLLTLRCKRVVEERGRRVRCAI